MYMYTHVYTVFNAYSTSYMSLNTVWMYVYVHVYVVIPYVFGDMTNFAVYM